MGGTSGDTAALTASPRTISTVDYDVGSVAIVDNGFKYKIKFEDNSGDLPDMVCNTDNLRSVYRLDQAAYVTRDEPDRVWFVDTKQGSAQPSYLPVAVDDVLHPSAITSGDTIYIGEQRCNVIQSDSDNTERGYQSQSVVCAQALSENAHSTADASACAMVLDYNGANRLVRWSSGENIAK